MEDLLKKINGNLIEIKNKQDRDSFHISGGEGNIGQINNILIHNQNFIELTYKKGKLNNLDKVVFLLLNISTITTFKIIDFDNILAREDIDKYCSDLICILDYEFKYNQNWDELKINKFIKKYLFKIEELKNLEAKINEFKNGELYWIVFDFLLTEKIKYNKMPDIKSIRLTMEFYEKNKDFDIHKFFGYEIDRLLKLDEIINDILGHYLFFIEGIKNWNYERLQTFFNSFNGKKTYNNLKLWLKENNIESNLLHYDDEIRDLQDLFNLALENNAFPDEDYELWMNLQLEFKDIFQKKIPNNETIETIKDARTNKNMSKVSLEDLKS